jgi:hypothetical protein
MDLKCKRLFWFFLTGLILFCFIIAFRFVSFNAVITLLIFNFLFISLIFQLNGSTTQKIGLLTISNIVGLFWNYVFHYFALAGEIYFGDLFSPIYTIAYPLLNLMWIVPMWSLSLGFLPKPEILG